MAPEPLDRSLLQVANPRRARPLWLRIGLWGLSCLLGWALVGILVITGLYLYVEDELPEIPPYEAIAMPATTRVYSQTGVLVGEFAIERRDPLRADQVPRRLVAAFLAAEDDAFFEHPGIDPLGILRAAWKTLKPGGRMEGGSTITQQVAKTFVGWDRTLMRKFKEAIVALRIEERYTKEQILLAYINRSNMGHGSHGVQAAARNYFDKNVWELDLTEIAALAALAQLPERYDLVDHPGAARDRIRWVLTRMHEEGSIDELEQKRASQVQLQARPIVDHFRRRAPWFTEEVRRQVQRRYGTQGLYEAGLTVETSLDLDYQGAAQRAMADGLGKVDRRQGYRGPLSNLASTEEQKDLLEKLKAAQGEAEPRPGEIAVALVVKVETDRAHIDTGGSKGVLPLSGMTWARPPDPTVHVRSARAKVKDVRKVLQVGDAILVRRLESGSLPKSASRVAADRKYELMQKPMVEGALLSTEPRMDYVRALIGGADFTASEFNRALQSCRQPGSTFKPIYYSLAIEQHGFNPATTILDSPVVYDDPEQGNRYKPQNPNRKYAGLVTLHTALVQSMAVPSIKVLEAVGLEDAIGWAARLGISTGLRPEVGLALGSSCVTLWDLAGAYSVFNQGGAKPEPQLIRKVTDRFGRVLLDNRSHLDPWQSWDDKLDRAYDRLVQPPERVMSPESAYITTHLLQGVATRGTGARSRALKKPVGGKTGTTNDSADTWFMGFTRDVVTGVWVGNDQPSKPLASGEDGSRTALPIWLSFMQMALADRPQAEFQVPPGITFARIDPLSGRLAPPGWPGSVVEAFRRGHVPTEAEGTDLPSDTRGMFEPELLP